jgi:hypothetical protein
VTRIHADNEFRSIVDEFDINKNLKFNFTCAKEHVPEVERNNRLIIKEEFLFIAYLSLKYQDL